MQARTVRARFAGPGELAQALKITVESQEGRSVARLEFIDTDSRRVKREVSGEDCAEVVSGIALVTALAIDARAKKEAAESSPRPAPSPPKPPPEPAPRADAVPSVGPTSGPKRTGIRWDTGLGLLATSAIAPTLLYGLDAFVAAGPRNARWSARLTLAYLEGPRMNVDRGEVRFRFGFARLEGCPVAWDLVSHLAFGPCAAFDAGIVFASGSGERIADPEDALVFLPIASALVRMQLDLQEFLLFELQGEVGVPLRPYRFVFEKPRALVHDVDPPRWGVGTAVGLRFEYGGPAWWPPFP